jgi:hypothetical protein
MVFDLRPLQGAGPLQFGMERKDVRHLLGGAPRIHATEPENDFYSEQGLIAGFDGKDALEYLEMSVPAIPLLDGIALLSLPLDDVVELLQSKAGPAPFDDGGYRFDAIGMAIYCPQRSIESVSVFREGYYDDL